MKYYFIINQLINASTVSLRALRRHRAPLGHNQGRPETRRNRSIFCPDSKTRTSRRHERLAAPNSFMHTYIHNIHAYNTILFCRSHNQWVWVIVVFEYISTYIYQRTNYSVFHRISYINKTPYVQYTYIHTYIHTFIHELNIHTCIHTYIHKGLHSYTLKDYINK